MATDLRDFSRTLFAAADQLWTNSALRPDQYAQPVLALIALRQMEAKFEAVHQEVAVKKVARELLDKLQEQLSVAEWQAKQ